MISDRGAYNKECLDACPSSHLSASASSKRNAFRNPGTLDRRIFCWSERKLSSPVPLDSLTERSVTRLTSSVAANPLFAIELANNELSEHSDPSPTPKASPYLWPSDPTQSAPTT